MCMPSKPVASRLSMHALIVALALIASLATSSSGQTPTRRDSTSADSIRADENACFGFSFGKWTPALDWQAAGHGTLPDAKNLQHAPDGRDWAADLSESQDSALVLFPAWWPAGVLVRLPKRFPAAGDTLRGRATALIADGRRQAPMAEVRAWAVPCRRRADAPPTTRP